MKFIVALGFLTLSSYNLVSSLGIGDAGGLIKAGGAASALNPSQLTNIGSDPCAAFKTMGSLQSSSKAGDGAQAFLSGNSKGGLDNIIAAAKAKQEADANMYKCQQMMSMMGGQGGGGLGNLGGGLGNLGGAGNLGGGLPNLGGGMGLPNIGGR